MSWLAPDAYDRQLFAALKDAADGPLWQHPFGRLCLVLAPALRVEPRLLRNARCRYLPCSDATIEKQFWFYRGVDARSVRAASLRAGLGRLLVDHVEASHDGPNLAELCAFISEQTRDWDGLDRLEQGLRWATRTADEQTAQDLLRELVRQVKSSASGRARADLARWIKGALPTLQGGLDNISEAGWLAKFAGGLLGDANGVLGGQGYDEKSVPAWMGELLPRKLSVLGLRLGRGDEGVLLECSEPEVGQPQLEVFTPLPAPVRIEPESTPPNSPLPNTQTPRAKWHALFPGCRVPLGEQVQSIVLQTLDGRRFRLHAREEPSDQQPPPDLPPATTTALIHAPDDLELARQIAASLQDTGITVRLLEQSRTYPASPNAPGFAIERVLRLWTRTSANTWVDADSHSQTENTPTLLLRSDGAVAPPPGLDAFDVLDISDWNAKHADRVHSYSTRIGEWLLNPGDRPDEGEHDPVARKSSEISKLLGELDNPHTTPPRRLEIGDRLAELGDTRHGVGVKEFELPATAAEPATHGSQQSQVPADGQQIAPAYAPEILSLLDEWDNPKTEPPRRLEIGDELASRGDPRPGVGLDASGLPDIAWVEIPGGVVTYRSEVLVPDQPPKRARKRQAAPLSMASFHLARYPVTNAQFQAFIDAGGYEDSQWWSGLRKPEPEKSNWPQPNRPRTDVDWYEATAYCRWLSAKLGYEIRLPTEKEWEWAARGRDGRLYPWGNEYRRGFANIDETFTKAGPWYLNQTTAVGAYPQGFTPEGIADLAGNVWEWCANRFDNPGQIEPGGSRDGRALRGGSWYDRPGDARADYRFRFDPGGRGGSAGFRLFSSAPIF